MTSDITELAEVFRNGLGELKSALTTQQQTQQQSYVDLVTSVGDLTKDVGRLVDVIEKHQKGPLLHRVEILERDVSGIRNGVSKFSWAVIGSGVCCAGAYLAKTLGINS